MSENSPEPSEPKKPFVLPMKWVVAAVLVFMLIYNFLLFRSATEEDPPPSDSVESPGE